MSHLGSVLWCFGQVLRKKEIFTCTERKAMNIYMYDVFRCQSIPDVTVSVKLARDFDDVVCVFLWPHGLLEYVALNPQLLPLGPCASRDQLVSGES